MFANDHFEFDGEVMIIEEIDQGYYSHDEWTNDFFSYLYKSDLWVPYYPFSTKKTYDQ